MKAEVEACTQCTQLLESPYLDWTSMMLERIGRWDSRMADWERPVYGEAWGFRERTASGRAEMVES